jgi:D-beta-D-heptose 7-phosphate kinase/D-beta-D-heptose 1-phosphate adenosyltransferase
MRILVIGDSCQDIFIYGNIERVCPEAPVPVFNPTHQTKNNGMAKNVVANLKALEVDVEIITNSNDIKKIRYVDNRSNQLVLRVDEHDYCDRVDKNTLTDLSKYDAIIVSDYHKGFLYEDDIKYICDTYDNVFLDVKKYLGTWVQNASFIKINEFEHKTNLEYWPDCSKLLKEKLIITRGGEGCEYMGNIFKTENVKIADVSGAGDTFLAGLTVEYMKTNDIIKAIKFAQDCTKIVVQKHGVSTVA